MSINKFGLSVRVNSNFSVDNLYSLRNFIRDNALCLNSSDFNAKDCRIQHLAEPKSGDDATNRQYVERAIDNIANEVRESTERTISSVEEVAAESKTVNAAQTERIHNLEDHVKVMKQYINYLEDNVMDIRTKFLEEVGTKKEDIKNLTNRINKIDNSITDIEHTLSEIVTEVRENVEKTTVSVKTLAGEIAANSKADNVAQIERIRVLENYLRNYVTDIQAKFSEEVDTREKNIKNLINRIAKIDSNITSIERVLSEIATNSKTDNVAQIERIRVIEESLKLMKHYTQIFWEIV